MHTRHLCASKSVRAPARHNPPPPPLHNNPVRASATLARGLVQLRGGGPFEPTSQNPTPPLIRLQGLGPPQALQEV